MKAKLFIGIVLCLVIGFLAQLPGDALSQEGTGTPQAPPTATLPPPPNQRPTVAQPPPTSLPPRAPTQPPPPNQDPDRFPSLTPSPTPTAGEVTATGTAPTIPPATLPPSQDGWTVYNNNDPRLQYSRNDWQPFEVMAAAGNTLTATNVAGATLTIEFDGTGIALLYSQGPEGGDFSAQLDDNLPLRATSKADNYTYAQRLEWTDLPAGPHTLTVTNGFNSLWIEAVEVQGLIVSGDAEIVIAGGLTNPGAVEPNAESGAQDFEDTNYTGEVIPTLLTTNPTGGYLDPDPFYTALGYQDKNLTTQAIAYAEDPVGGSTTVELVLEMAFSEDSTTFTVKSFTTSWYTIIATPGEQSIPADFTSQLTYEMLAFDGSVLDSFTCQRFEHKVDGDNCNRPFTFGNGLPGVHRIRLTTSATVPNDYDFYGLGFDNFEVTFQVPPTDTPVPSTATSTPTVPGCTPDVQCPTNVDIEFDPDCIMQVKANSSIVLRESPQDAANNTGNEVITMGENDYLAPIGYWETPGSPIVFVRVLDNGTSVWGWADTGDKFNWVAIPQGKTEADCIANLAIVQQSDLPGPTPTPTIAPTATPTAPPSNLLSLIQAFGGYVAIDGGLDPQNNTTHESILRAVLKGFEDTANALNVKYPIADPNNTLDYKTFRAIMFANNPDDTPIAFVFWNRPTNGGNLTCATRNGGAGADTEAEDVLEEDPNTASFTGYQAIIECDIELGTAFSSYTTTHELGHVFMGVTGGHQEKVFVNNQVYQTFFGFIHRPEGFDPNTGDWLDRQAIRDSEGDPILGYVSQMNPATYRFENNWTRGGPILGTDYNDDDNRNEGRGWGSSAHIEPDPSTGNIRIADAPACDFQQNPYNPFGSTFLTEKIEEAAADMFLNWVYEIIQPQGLGFENIRWNNDSNCHLTGISDSSDPGDARFEWMENILADIGNRKTWS